MKKATKELIKLYESCNSYLNVGKTWRDAGYINIAREGNGYKLFIRTKEFTDDNVEAYFNYGETELLALGKLPLIESCIHSLRIARRYGKV